MLNIASRRTLVLGTIAFAVIIGAGSGVLLIASGDAEGSTSAAAQRIQALGPLNPDAERAVATVNGVPIPARTLDVHVATAELLGIGTKTAEQILQDLIDDELLAQAAAAYGITVTEAEVDAAIQAGLLDPLKDDRVTKDIKELSTSILAAQGVTADSALRDEGVRHAYRGLVFRGRYINAIGKSREEILPQLRAEANIAFHDAAMDRRTDTTP